MLKTTLLFFATALCEIIGCFLPWLWLKKGGTVLLLIPASVALALFVWLLTLHPAASGRVYAAYGGVYVCTALLWLRVVDGVRLSAYDWAGALIALREHGLSVPEDVLVTGFDDSQLANSCGPGITSVHQDVSKMAQLATGLLLEMICGKMPKQTYYQLPVYLEVRASTRR